MPVMTKTQAIAVFGSQAELARALGVSRGYVSQWPEELPAGKADRVRGAAARLGKPLPDAVRTAGNGRGQEVAAE